MSSRVKYFRTISATFSLRVSIISAETSRNQPTFQGIPLSKRLGYTCAAAAKNTRVCSIDCTSCCRTEYSFCLKCSKYAIVSRKFQRFSLAERQIFHTKQTKTAHKIRPSESDFLTVLICVLFQQNFSKKLLSNFVCNDIIMLIM